MKNHILINKTHSFAKKLLPLCFSLTFIVALFIIINYIKNNGYHIVYTQSYSVPRGLYLITPLSKKPLSHYVMVEFIPPQKAQIFLEKQGLIPKNSTLLKYIFALPEDHVCIQKGAIWINGQKIAPVKKFHAPNKLLPQTKICSKLGHDQYILISTLSKRSFDSRYFGSVALHNIKGYALPLKTEN